MADKEAKIKAIKQDDVTPEEANAVAVADETPVKAPKTAKAGKRSAKALAEAEADQVKAERKESDDEEVTSHHTQKPSRSRRERQGKAIRAKADLIEKDKQYDLKQAIELAIKTNPSKFDATVELHINLNVNPRHADQNLRDNLVLPAGTGKNVTVAVFDDAAAPDADISGVETISKLLDKGTITFDILIATPAQMPKLGKYARLLGPRGLMPNPKSGTVTPDVNKAVKEAKAGRVEYRVDSTGIVHLGVGKVSFGQAKITDNINAIFSSIKSNKPASVKGVYVKAIHLSTTMGPSINVTPNL